MGVTSMSFNVWWPFMPLYALKLGASSDADALFWVAIATTAQGVARLLSGRVWGVLSDRVGRKAMFLRALFLSTLVGAVAAFAQAPWHLAISLTLAGLFSGFNPAAIALISVSVKESQLNKSLSILTGAQYIGTTAGPAVGALLAIVVGYRGAIFASSLVPLMTGTAVLFLVPRDRIVTTISGKSVTRPALEPFKMSYQFLLAIFLYFMVFGLNQLLRFVTPAALGAIEGSEDVAGHVGIVFSLAGLISAISVLFVGPYFFRLGRIRPVFVVATVLGALGMIALSMSGSTLTYVGGFLVIAAMLSAMTPATNTLIAANVTRSRRGTAFGVAGSAQALASIIGPAGAALFAAISLDAGFAILAALMLALGLLLGVTMREPHGMSVDVVETA